MYYQQLSYEEILGHLRNSNKSIVRLKYPQLEINVKDTNCSKKQLADELIAASEWL